MNYVILEFNGSGAEPNHVYNAGYSLFEAYEEILKHWKALYKISKPGDSVLVVVKRKKEGSDEKEDVTLSGQMMKLPVRKYNLLNFKTDITPQQKLVQDSWLAATQ